MSTAKEYRDHLKWLRTQEYRSWMYARNITNPRKMLKWVKHLQRIRNEKEATIWALSELDGGAS